MVLKLIDTFAGIGGFSYAAEKLVGGFKTIQFVEIDPYCQKVLNKNFPNIPIHDDITTFRAEPYSAHIITGGFPCQSISIAGRREGISETTRSGLWFELIRTIRMVRPKYFILENVSAILANGMDIVLRDIFETGLYECEWCCIPSSFVGACHQRDRWFLLGFARSIRTSDVTNSNNNGSLRTEKSRSFEKTDGRSEKGSYFFIESEGSSKSKDSGNIQLSFTYTESKRTWKNESRLWGQSQGGDMQTNRDSNKEISVASNTNSNGLQGEIGTGIYRPTWETKNTRRLNPNWRQYISKPTIRRGDDGFSNRMDGRKRSERLKQLGNSVVPQVCAIPLQRVIQLERDASRNQSSTRDPTSSRANS